MRERKPNPFIDTRYQQQQQQQQQQQCAGTELSNKQHAK